MRSTKFDLQSFKFAFFVYAHHVHDKLLSKQLKDNEFCAL